MRLLAMLTRHISQPTQKSQELEQEADAQISHLAGEVRGLRNAKVALRTALINEMIGHRRRRNEPK